MSAYIDTLAYRAMSLEERVEFDDWVDSWAIEEWRKRSYFAIEAVPDGQGLMLRVTRAARNAEGRLYVVGPPGAEEGATEDFYVHLPHWPMSWLLAEALGLSA